MDRTADWSSVHTYYCFGVKYCRLSCKNQKQCGAEIFLKFYISIPWNIFRIQIFDLLHIRRGVPVNWLKLVPPKKLHRIIAWTWFLKMKKIQNNKLWVTLNPTHEFHELFNEYIFFLIWCVIFICLELIVWVLVSWKWFNL